MYDTYNAVFDRTIEILHQTKNLPLMDMINAFAFLKYVYHPLSLLKGYTLFKKSLQTAEELYYMLFLSCK